MVIVFCCASQLVHSAPGKGRVPPPEGKKEFGVWLVGKKLVLRNVDSKCSCFDSKAGEQSSGILECTPAIPPKKMDV